MPPPLRVLVVGQTPPPYGGQAMAIESFLRGSYDRVELTHVRMAFSNSMEEVGKVRLGKALHLVGLVARILRARLRSRAEVLYYPPAGPDLVPVLRDIVILLCCRWAFRRTVFHFHASGLSEIYPSLPRPVRVLFDRAYRHPDIAIQSSELNPADSAFLAAERAVVVHGGVPDLAGPIPTVREADDPPVLLFVGVLRESKGLLVLVEAARLLTERGCVFELHLMGQFESAAFEERLRQAVADADLTRQVVFLGVRTGEDKLACYRRADVFCYPTHFESESFGLVLLEAMQFGLPVVTTNWRGVPTSVRDGETGFLVPVHRPDLFADRVQQLLTDPALAERAGRAGRALYLGQFTEQRYRLRMEDALMLLTEKEAS